MFACKGASGRGLEIMFERKSAFLVAECNGSLHSPGNILVGVSNTASIVISQPVPQTPREADIMASRIRDRAQDVDIIH